VAGLYFELEVSIRIYGREVRFAVRGFRHDHRIVEGVGT
jgi:hypothetical protein